MMQFMLTFLLLVAHFATQARAEYLRCSWELGKKPSELGFKSWCTADYFSHRLGSVVYKCKYSAVQGRIGQVVADWNLHEQEVLKFRTPCGRRGYANAEGCPSLDWAVCIDDNETNCRGLKATDCCESDVCEGNRQWRVA